MRADIIERVEDGMHGADEVELDDRVPVDAFFAKCRRRVEPLKLYGHRYSHANDRWDGGTHVGGWWTCLVRLSRRKLVGIGLRTGLALAEQKKPHHPHLLPRNALQTYALVNLHADPARFLLLRYPARLFFGSLIQWWTQDGVKRVVVRRLARRHVSET